MDNPDHLRSEKQKLRRELLSRRDAMPADERLAANTAIGQALLSLPEIARAGSVFCFISTGSEVDTHPLLDHLLNMGKSVLAPRIPRGEPMQAVPFEGWSDLTPGALGILTPASSVAHAGAVDVVITPGVGFTQAGQRLGYGRGYYDRWFATHAHHRRIAIAFECQVIDTLPVTGTDVPVHEIVTERRRITVKDDC